MTLLSHCCEKHGSAGQVRRISLTDESELEFVTLCTNQKTATAAPRCADSTRQLSLRTQSKSSSSSMVVELSLLLFLIDSESTLSCGENLRCCLGYIPHTSHFFHLTAAAAVVAAATRLQLAALSYHRACRFSGWRLLQGFAGPTYSCSMPKHCRNHQS